MRRNSLDYLQRKPSPHGDLNCFLDLFYRRTGIRFPPHKLPLIQRRTDRALREAGQSSFSVGVAYLITHPDGPVMQAVINALTINETYFFRELEQLKLLSRHLLPGIERTAGPIKVLSVPCSTGEEPYSIMIHCREALPAATASRVQVFGADIDSAAVAQAKEATYRERSVSRLPDTLVRRYFRATQDRMFELDRTLQRSVTFNVANLLDASITRQFRMLDVVFCRNVLIYFDAEAKIRALKHLHNILRPGGVLLLGHAEQITRLDVPFRTERIAGQQVHIRT